MMTPLLDQNYLTGQLLIASPQIMDTRFSQAVILICGHDQNGAMGIVLNRLIEGFRLEDLMEQLDLKSLELKNSYNIPIHYGGPIEMGRGFVLHSTDYLHDASIKVSNEIALTSTVEILNLIARGQGPREKRLALGYAGWSAGQLENELQKNSWLHVSSDTQIVFTPELTEVWQMALSKIGVDPVLLSSEMGHA